MADDAPSGLPKWQVGVAVGAGIALAATAGYVYYRSRQGEPGGPGAESPSTASQANSSSQQAGTTAGRNDSGASVGGSSKATAAAGSSGDSSAAAAAPETPLQLVQKCKSRGNQLYKEGKYEEAIVSYREGLEHCPASESSQLSIFYQNVAATYERIAERASEEPARAKYWGDVRQACTSALEHNKKYVKAYVRRARSNFMLKDFTDALEDITAANLLESTEGSGAGAMRGPSEQVIELASRILKDLGEAKSEAYYNERPPIKVSKTFIRSYLNSFYFDLAQFYDVSDSVIADCVAESERELQAIGLGTDGEEYAGPESVKLPVSRDTLGYRCPDAGQDTTDSALVEPTVNGEVQSESELPARTESGSTQDEEFADAEATTPAPEEEPAKEQQPASKTPNGTASSQPDETTSQPDESAVASEPAKTSSQPEDSTETDDVTAPGDETTAAKTPEDPTPNATVTSPAAALEDGEVIEDNEPKASSESASEVSQGAQLYLRAVLKYKNEQFPLGDQACRRARLLGEDQEGFFTKTQLAHLYLLEATIDQMYSRFDSAMKNLNAVVAMEKDIPAELLSHALIKRGSQHLVNAKTDEALLDFQQASTFTPNSTDVFHHRGQMHSLMDHMNEAVTDYQQSVKLAPDWPAASIQLAYATYKMAGMSQSMMLMTEAMGMFEKIKQDFPDNAEGLYMYAQVKADSGNIPDAEELYAMARKADPQNVSVLVHEALLTLQKTQDFDTAAHQLEAALELDPNSDFVYETMAQLEVQRHNIDKALALWDKALSLVRTRFEMMNLFSLREATRAQAKVSKSLGIDLSAFMPEGM